MRKIILLSILVNLILSCSSDDSNNNENQSTNGFTVNSVFYPTPNFIIGATTDDGDSMIYEFYFTDGEGTYIHLDMNSPNLNQLTEMTYPIINESGRQPGISLLRKNGFGFPGEDEDYYYLASANYKDGFIKVYKENNKLVFEYEFNYFDTTKSIKGYAKQP